MLWRCSRYDVSATSSWWSWPFRSIHLVDWQLVQNLVGDCGRRAQLVNSTRRLRGSFFRRLGCTPASLLGRPTLAILVYIDAVDFGLLSAQSLDLRVQICEKGFSSWCWVLHFAARLFVKMNYLVFDVQVIRSFVLVGPPDLADQCEPEDSDIGLSVHMKLDLSRVRTQATNTRGTLSQDREEHIGFQTGSQSTESEN